MTTKFNPVGHRLIVRLSKFEEQVEVPEALKAINFKVNHGEEDKYIKAATDFGFVVAIGPTAWKHADFGGEPWCKVGDEIVFGKYASKLFEHPDDVNNTYAIINDEDVQMIIERS